MNRNDMITALIDYKIRRWTLFEVMQCIHKDTTLYDAEKRLFDMYSTRFEQMPIGELTREHTETFQPQRGYTV